MGQGGSGFREPCHQPHDDEDKDNVAIADWNRRPTSSSVATQDQPGDTEECVEPSSASSDDNSTEAENRDYMLGLLWTMEEDHTLMQATKTKREICWKAVRRHMLARGFIRSMTACRKRRMRLLHPTHKLSHTVVERWREDEDMLLVRLTERYVGRINWDSILHDMAAEGFVRSLHGCRKRITNLRKKDRYARERGSAKGFGAKRASIPSPRYRRTPSIRSPPKPASHASTPTPSPTEEPLMGDANVPPNHNFPRTSSGRYAPRTQRHVVGKKEDCPGERDDCILVPLSADALQPTLVNKVFKMASLDGQALNPEDDASPNSPAQKKKTAPIAQHPVPVANNLTVPTPFAKTQLAMATVPAKAKNTFLQLIDAEGDHSVRKTKKTVEEPTSATVPNTPIVRRQLTKEHPRSTLKPTTTPVSLSPPPCGFEKVSESPTAITDIAKLNKCTHQGLGIASPPIYLQPPATCNVAVVAHADPMVEAVTTKVVSATSTGDTMDTSKNEDEALAKKYLSSRFWSEEEEKTLSNIMNTQGPYSWKFVSELMEEAGCVRTPLACKQRVTKMNSRMSTRKRGELPGMGRRAIRQEPAAPPHGCYFQPPGGRSSGIGRAVLNLESKAEKERIADRRMARVAAARKWMNPGPSPAEFRPRVDVDPMDTNESLIDMHIVMGLSRCPGLRSNRLETDGENGYDVDSDLMAALPTDEFRHSTAGEWSRSEDTLLVEVLVANPQSSWLEIAGLLKKNRVPRSFSAVKWRDKALRELADKVTNCKRPGTAVMRNAKYEGPLMPVDDDGSSVEPMIIEPVKEETVFKTKSATKSAKRPCPSTSPKADVEEGRLRVLGKSINAELAQRTAAFRAKKQDEKNTVPVKRSRRSGNENIIVPGWSTLEEEALLNVMTCIPVNGRTDWKDVSMELNSAGFRRTAEKCQYKMASREMRSRRMAGQVRRTARSQVQFQNVARPPPAPVQFAVDDMFYDSMSESGDSCISDISNCGPIGEIEIF